VITIKKAVLIGMIIVCFFILSYGGPAADFTDDPGVSIAQSHIEPIYLVILFLLIVGCTVYVVKLIEKQKSKS